MRDSLGQALFLTLTAKPDETSPTARGLFVREQFLCQHVADPPPGVNTNLPPVTEAQPMTNRDRMAMHATSKACAGCHNLVDPIGFGFEKFDAIGQRRDKLKLTFGESFRGEQGGAGQSSPPWNWISTPKARWPEFPIPVSRRPRNWARCWPPVRSARNAW